MTGWDAHDYVAHSAAQQEWARKLAAKLRLRTTWFPYTDRLPAGLRDAFLDDVAAAYTAARPPDDEGVIHLRMVRLEVEARVASAPVG